ncbi:MAG: polyribonucleotide nucleotidyltransferase [Patescibacteria group bacterium]
MDLKRKIFKSELGGEALSLEISEIAHKANGAVIGRHGETAVLATVVMGETEKTTDYFPLTVDYEERFYAAGKIMGSRFVRREGRPSDEAMLSARLIDRTIRPLFDDRLRREVQVVVTILAYDEKNDPDAIALLAASTALGISNIPWGGPVAGIKTQNLNSDGSLNYQTFFAGPKARINMLEFEGKEIKEEEVLKQFNAAQKEIERLIDFQEKIIKELGKPKTQVMLAEPTPKTKKLITDIVQKDLAAAIKNKTLHELKKLMFEKIKTSEEASEALLFADRIFENLVNDCLHKEILERDNRPDGRKLDEVRDLHGEIGIFNRNHGSGLFMRGDTQVLAVTTLGTVAAEQIVETMEFSGRKRFMLHYNFPGFAVGETGRARGGPGRREIGHGALAQKALAQVLPSKDDFPYTIRIVAETLSSNGSSSMASTCAGSLSLMDAGVPIKKHVAGIAMGLVLHDNGQFKVLTDIQGPEDHHGDMDLKVAGTDSGITAMQMDVKVQGITAEIFENALAKAKKARLHILETMNKTIAAPKKSVSTFAPKIYTVLIRPEKIGLVVGPGGRTINGMIAAAGGLVTIDIEQTGKIYVAGTDETAVQKTLAYIKQITHEYMVGEIVEGEIVRILDFGAIVDLGGDQDGMIHVSELQEGFVKKVEDVVHLGDRVKAKVVRVEEGKIALSLKGAKVK